MNLRNSPLMVALWALSFVAVTAHAKGNNYPQSLSGFIKPGMHLGLRSNQDDSSVYVRILTEEQVKIIEHSRGMNFQEIFQEYPTVAKGELRSYVSRPMSVYTVAHVDDDYILLAYGQDSTTLKALATRFIASVAGIEKCPPAEQKQNQSVNPSGGSGDL